MKTFYIIGADDSLKTKPKLEFDENNNITWMRLNFTDIEMTYKGGYLSTYKDSVGNWWDRDTCKYENHYVKDIHRFECSSELSYAGAFDIDVYVRKSDKNKEVYKALTGNDALVVILVENGKLEYIDMFFGLSSIVNVDEYTEKLVFWWNMSRDLIR